MKFQSFLLRYQFADREVFQETFALGCLLSSARTTSEGQAPAEVYPLRKRSGGSGVVSRQQDSTADHAEAKRVVVGRSGEADIVILGATVSKKHAYFTEVRGALHLVDMGSSNGTIVNGEAAERRRRIRLEPGITEIWFGDEQFFHFDAAALFGYLEHLSTLSRRSEGDAPDPEARFTAELLGTVSPAPSPLIEDEPPTSRMARLSDSGRARREQAPTVPATRAGEEHEEGLERHQPPTEAEQTAKWEQAKVALHQLFPKLERVCVKLSTQLEPFAVYERHASSEGDPLESMVRTLESMHWLIEYVEASFSASSFVLKVFEK